MASIIKLKRSSTSGAVPESLQVGEIAVNLFDKKLYVGNTAGVSKIGGEDFRLTTMDAGGDGVYLRLLGDTPETSNNVLLAAGEGLNVTRDSSNGTITFSGEDASDTNKGIAKFDSGDFSVSSGNVSLADDANGAVLGISGTANEVDVSRTNGTVTVGLPDDVDITSTLDVGSDATVGGTLDVTGATTLSTLSTSGAATLNSTSVTNNATVGGTLGVTGATTLSSTLAAGATTITGDASISGDMGSATATVSGNATVGGTLGVTGATTLSSTLAAGATTITGDASISGDMGSATATVSGNATVGGTLDVTGNVTAQNNLTVNGDATIDGSLTVEGELTYISTSTVYADDSMFKLSANNASDTVDSGIYAKYIDGATSKYSGYFRDASSDTFKFYTGLQTEPSTTVDVSATGYTLAQLDAVIDGGAY